MGRMACPATRWSNVQGMKLLNPVQRVFEGSAGQVFRGMVTMALGSGAAKGIGLLVVPLLTRIYSPEDYGVLSVFTALIFVLVQGSDPVGDMLAAPQSMTPGVSCSLPLTASVADAITLIDPAGNHKLAKSRSTGRIDAAAATVLAVAQGIRMAGAPKNKGGRIAWG